MRNSLGFHIFDSAKNEWLTDNHRRGRFAVGLGGAFIYHTGDPDFDFASAQADCERLRKLNPGRTLYVMECF